MEKRKLIGIFATEISSRIQGSLYSALHEKTTEKGYNLILFSGTGDKIRGNVTADASDILFSIAKNLDYEAIIVHAQSLGSTQIVTNLIAFGQEKRIPVFVYDCESFGIKSGSGVYTINPDYKGGFAESVRHLIEHHGCRHIFMLAGMKNNRFSDERVEMYRREMATHGIEYSEEQIGYGDFWELPAEVAVNKFLDSGLPMDAICCANDAMAICAAKVLKQRGVRVPEEVLVTGFDGIEDGKYNMPAISTCEPELGAVSDYILDVLEGSCREESFLIPLRFMPKESCGCGVQKDFRERIEVVKLLENTRQNAWLHHMVAAMQFDMMDKCDLCDCIGYMEGTLNYFKNYSFLFAVREDLEDLEDYSVPLEKMRVHLSKGFLTDMSHASFSVKEIIPDFYKLLEASSPEDMFMLRMIFCSEKIYGYTALKTTNYSANEIKLMGQFVESFTNIIENTLRNMRLRQATQKLNDMYRRMSEIYVHDMLTGLYNRSGYYQALKEYMEKPELQEGYLHLISIDMDGMKRINDNYGHHEGDYAIKTMAQAILDCFSHPCISARFGGDEFFVALFTEGSEEPTQDRISAKLNNYLKSTPLLADKRYRVGASVGQAVTKLSELRDINEIEKIADDCMYQNKRQRKAAQDN